MMQTIKLEHGFNSEGWKFNDGVQDGRQLGSLDLYDQQTRNTAF